MDFMEEYECVMATRDEWFTLGFVLTHLKWTEAHFRLVSLKLGSDESILTASIREYSSISTNDRFTIPPKS